MATLFEYRDYLITGLITTVGVTLAGIALMTILMIVFGMALLSRHRPIRRASRVYVEFFRGTSLLVQLFWWYYALPFFGISLPALLVGVVGLGLNSGAYGAEVVRVSIKSVPIEQVEAGKALNLSPTLIMRLIVLPQAFRIMLPPYANLCVELLKGTSVVALITIAELTFSARYIAVRTFQTEPAFIAILICYFVLATLIVVPIRRLERRLRLV